MLPILRALSKSRNLPRKQSKRVARLLFAIRIDRAKVNRLLPSFTDTEINATTGPVLITKKIAASVELRM